MDICSRTLERIKLEFSYNLGYDAQKMKQKEMGMPGSDTEAVPVVQYEGQQYPVKSGQSVLDALLEARVRVPFSCRSGLCHACMMETIPGTAPGIIPASAQAGLSSEQMTKGAFLACQCHPQHNISIQRPDRQQQTEAIVTAITVLSPTVKALTISPRIPLDYRPGQYMSVWKDKDACRDLSLVSLPETDSDITFHVERHTCSAFSRWVHDELKPGQQITVGNVRGSCHYHSGNPAAPILLIGFETGIGALHGVIKDAVEQEHRGSIQVIHATTSPADLYLNEELKYLTAHYKNILYEPVTGSHIDEQITALLSKHALLDHADIFICGSSTPATHMYKWLKSEKPDIKHLYCDAFHHQSGT